MKWFTSGLFLAQLAFGAIHQRDLHLHARQSSSKSPVAPDVPEYTVDLPVDHFSSSNKNTFSNRYYVNDTYYKEGGPVLILNLGEQGWTKSAAGLFLADFFAEQGDTESGVLKLASEVNGLVIGWEHRYYGKSLVVKHDKSTGLPIDGADGYKYLTVDQAIEDMAYFANNFNTTKLSKNENVQSGKNLDPYNTPWIVMGGSYSGSLAAWARLKHPEVFYAGWSSSAPVQTQEDGSIYFNAVARHLPSNCTADIEAIVKYIDGLVEDNNTDDFNAMSQLLGIITSGSSKNAPVYETIYEFAGAFSSAILFGQFGQYQMMGALHTTRPMCDYMETFDVEQFLDDVSSAEDVNDIATAIVNNPGQASFSKKGVAETYGSKQGPAVAWAALMFGLYYGSAEASDYLSNLPTGVATEDDETYPWDSTSWDWQARTEMGYWQGSNSSDEYQIISAYYNYTIARDVFYDTNPSGFRSFSADDLPENINNTQFLDLGGWDLKASNVYFGVGEYDPWTAFSVATEEQKYGAPKRKMTTTVPKCNQVPSGSDTFGIVYKGAVHVEDLSTPPYIRGSLAKKTPVEEAVELFTKAWKEWEPCFNESRDSVRNGKGVNGDGKGADGESTDGKDKNSGGDDDDDDSGSVLANSLNMGLAGLMATLVVFMTL